MLIFGKRCSTLLKKKKKKKDLANAVQTIKQLLSYLEPSPVDDDPKVVLHCASNSLIIRQGVLQP